MVLVVLAFLSIFSGFSWFSGFCILSGFSVFIGFSVFSGFSGFCGFSGFSGISWSSQFNGSIGFCLYSGCTLKYFTALEFYHKTSYAHVWNLPPNSVVSFIIFVLGTKTAPVRNLYHIVINTASML